MQELNTYIEGFHLNQSEAVKFCNADCEAKGPSPANVRDVLPLFNAQKLNVRNGSYPWLSTVCWNRSFFTDCCFRVITPDGNRNFKLAYALQKPLLCAFQKVREVAVEDPEMGMARFFDYNLHVFRHNFEILLQPDMIVYSDDSPFDAAWPVEVLVDCKYRHGGKLVSDAHWVAWDTIAWRFARGRHIHHEDTGVEPARPTNDDSNLPIWVTCPWLIEDWTALYDAEFKGADRSGRDGIDDGGGEPDEDMGDDADLAEALAALDARRAFWNVDGNDTVLVDFTWALRGGGWTALHRGVPYDSFRGQAANGTAKLFCQLYGFAQSNTFSIALFGEAHAQQLARMWCDKLQFFFNMWIENLDAGNYHFVDADIAMYVEPAWVDELADGPEQTVRRCNGIRALRPAAPRV